MMRRCLTFLLFVALAWSQSERECKCILNNLYLDVYIVIDDSAQMGVPGLTEVAANVNSVFGFSQIRVGDHYADGRGVRTAVVTYNSHATLRSNLSDFQSTDSLTSLVYSLKPNTVGTSNLQEALLLVQQMMHYTDKNAPRNNTQSVILVYAADYYDFEAPLISDVGNILKAKGVKIITVADITRNDHSQIRDLARLATPGNSFNINDDYVSEEVQQAFCRANCFCPQMYQQFAVQNNDTTHNYGTCVRAASDLSSWTNAKFSCQNLQRTGYLATEFSKKKHAFNRDLFKSMTNSNKYHVGLHFVNGGYFWEQSVGLSLVPLTQQLYPLDAKPASNLQCVSNNQNGNEEVWENVNCFTELRPYLCEVAACDTENFCA